MGIKYVFYDRSFRKFLLGLIILVGLSGVGIYLVKYKLGYQSFVDLSRESKSDNSENKSTDSYDNNLLKDDKTNEGSKTSDKSLDTKNNSDKVLVNDDTDNSNTEVKTVSYTDAMPRSGNSIHLSVLLPVILLAVSVTNFLMSQRKLLN